MEENQETIKPRPGFEDLNNPEKVRAILGAVREPVSKDLALRFSGIDLNEVDEEERAEVEAVFEEKDIEKSEVDNQERYWLSDAARNKIEEEIDMKSVHSAIADRMLEDLRQKGIEL